MEIETFLKAYKGNKEFPQLVIYLLEKEGGINFYQWTGEDDKAWYFINDEKHIFCSQIVPDNYTKVDWPDFHPIQFSPQMVKAILGLRKSMTRRTKGLEQFSNPNDADIDEDTPGRYMMCHCINGIQWIEDLDTLESIDVKCTYGKPGDILWVRENYFKPPVITDKMYRDGADTWPKFDYSASCSEIEIEQYKDWGWKHKPSIHMPKVACRLFLKIKSVRVERLNEISEKDAKAEGINIDTRQVSLVRHWIDYENKNNSCTTAIGSFMSLWRSINGPDSCDANPWVWVIEFEKIL